LRGAGTRLTIEHPTHVSRSCAISLHAVAVGVRYPKECAPTGRLELRILNRVKSLATE